MLSDLIERLDSLVYLIRLERLTMADCCPETEVLLDRALEGDEASLAELFDRHRDRLISIVQLRLDRRLKRRVDPEDIVQEVFIAVQKKFSDYASDQKLPFFLWLRLETGQKLIDAHRFHLGAKMRDAGMEISLSRGGMPAVESITLAERLLGRLTSASHAAMRAEVKQRVQDALNDMEPDARELLLLRHFEELSNGEAAQLLNISPTAAYGRYLRAVRRLKSILELVPGGDEML